jgi:4-hydroxy-2-oxoheptanedioate aldolase
VPCGHPHVDTKNVEGLIEQGFRFLMPGVVSSFAALEKGLKASGRA